MQFYEKTDFMKKLSDLQSSFNITRLSKIKGLTPENVVSYIGIAPHFNLSDYDTIRSMVNRLQYIKVLASNIHLVSRNNFGDPECRSWSIGFTFKFVNIGNIEMSSDFSYIKCTNL